MRLLLPLLLALAACGSFGTETTAPSDAGGTTPPPGPGGSDGGLAEGGSTGPARTLDIAMGKGDIADGPSPVHACVLIDGAVRCWGNDHYGQTQKASNPVVTDAVEIAAGDDHTCARMKDDTLRCWGYNFHGALGVPDNERNFALPPNGVVKPAISGVEQVTAGYGHTCIRRGAKAQCFGKRSDGELLKALESTTQHQPVEIADSVTRIAAGYKSTCILQANGLIRCTGANDFGQVGITASQQREREFSTVTTLKPASFVVAGRNVACALVDGDAYCWGNGNAFGSSGPQPVPTRVGTGPYVTIAAGDRVCALRAGRHDVDCPGVTTATQHLDEEIARIATSLATFCAVTTTGKLLCWGDLQIFSLPPSTKPVEI